MRLSLDMGLGSIAALGLRDTVPPGDLTGVTVAGGLGVMTVNYTTPVAPNLSDVVVYRVASGGTPTDANIVAALTQSVPPSTATPKALTDGDATRTDIVVGGGFGNSAEWPTQLGGASVTAGKAVHVAGVSGSVRQSQALTVSKRYRFKLDVDSISGSTMTVTLLGGTQVNSANISTTGTKLSSVLNNATANNVLALVFAASTVASVDNLSMFEETPTCLAQGNYDIYLKARNGSGYGNLQGPYAITVV